MTHAVDYILVFIYFTVVLFIGIMKRRRPESSAAELILGGRSLTLPAFVASLVSTWYGGILGVGEYSYLYGLSNWLVFGLPYYLAAFLFAIFLSRRARQSEALTIPDRLATAYDNRTSVAGGIIIFLMTVPAAYVLMLGVLCQYLFGWPLWVGVMLGTAFSVVYLFTGGFRAVVRTDILQFGLMFAGFAVLLIILVMDNGGYSFLKANLPETHLTWHGGNSAWYIAVWYFIALATLIEPAFYQRCYAAKNTKIARSGIFISIICWTIFDFMTTTCGLYARALLPELTDPVASYPALAISVLPPGLLGLFALALLATVMSTVDSYAFLCATTFSRDIVMRLRKTADGSLKIITGIGLVLAVSLSAVLALFFESVIDIWHLFGTIGTPALLIPVFTSFTGRRRLDSGPAFVSIIASGLVALIWYLSKFITPDNSYWFEIEPIFPGLAVSLAIYFSMAREKVNH